MAPKRASSAGGGSGDDRVRVVVRIRPPVRKDEKFGDGSESLQYDKERNLLFLLAQDEKEKDKQYVFDKVLFKDSVQYDAWESAGLPVVNSVPEVRRCRRRVWHIAPSDPYPTIRRRR